jgi:hypothetical protein
VFEEEELRDMSLQDRLSLLRALTALDRQGQEPSLQDLGSSRRRAVALAIIVACCIGLAIWVGVLAVTLPRYYRAGGWRGAWVGFDLALLMAFAATGWAAWRRRQVLIICLVVLATLLCCDAWFDVLLDAHTSGFEFSLLSALVVELPLAALATLAARRLLRMTSAVSGWYAGKAGPLPRLRELPLLGLGPADQLRNLLADSAEGRPPRAGEPGSPVPSGRDQPGPASLKDGLRLRRTRSGSDETPPP